MKTNICVLLFVCCILCSLPSASQELPSPEQFFGHQMGADGKIVDYFKSLEYYRLLADRSGRIDYVELGKTTNGNPFVLLVISSPANLSDLDRLKAERDRLSDPRSTNAEEAKRLAAELPAVVMHTGSIHTTEISCVQVLPELVYLLANGQSPGIINILDNTIVLVIACANPDGQVMIKEWYEEHKGRPWEGRMPWLYHPYVGHDDNRDWILLHFPEQRLTATRVFNEWHPIYSVEMHQMGSSGARIFVPPYKDPHDPNTAPQVVEAMSIIGMAMSHRLTAEGKGGVVKNAIFDLYTPARAYQVNHGTARILTETASADFASAKVLKPEDLQQRRSRDYHVKKASWNFPMPWPGGTWTFREMVEYQLSANLAALELAAAQRYTFNLAYWQALKRACDGEGWPYAYVLPAGQRDPGSAAALLRALQRGAIEIHRAAKPFTADGREFGEGSYVIILRQPFAAWAKSLLEVQDYPDLRKSPGDPPPTPYDMTAHTLPLLMGVEAAKIEEQFDAELEPVKEPVAARGHVVGKGKSGYAVFPCSNDAYWLADELLDAGFRVSRLHKPKTVGELELPAGSFIIAPTRDLKGKLEQFTAGRSFKALGLKEGLTTADLVQLRNPRIGLFEPWGGSMDIGWTRWVLELWGLEYLIVRSSDISAGSLNDDYDIIIFPDGLRAEGLIEGNGNLPPQYAEGIGSAGISALMIFLENGGTITAFGRSSITISELLGVPIENKLEGMQPRQFFCPGSILLTVLEPENPLAYGSPSKVATMASRPPAYIPVATTGASPEIIGTFPQYNPLMSGYLIGPEQLYGAGSIAVQNIGKGRVILFAFRPQFRAMTDGTYKLLFNAIFWAGEAR